MTASSIFASTPHEYGTIVNPSEFVRTDLGVARSGRGFGRRIRLSLRAEVFHSGHPERAPGYSALAGCVKKTVAVIRVSFTVFDEGMGMCKFLLGSTESLLPGFSTCKKSFLSRCRVGPSNTQTPGLSRALWSVVGAEGNNPATGPAPTCPRFERTVLTPPDGRSNSRLHTAEAGSGP